MLLRSLALCSSLAVTASAQQLRVGGFDDTRTVRPLSDVTPMFGYGNLLNALAAPGNFGPNGVVDCAVTLAGETGLVDAAYLATIDVFYTGAMSGNLSAAELTALADWHLGGGHVIVIADSNYPSNPPADAVIAALGGDSNLLSIDCSNGPDDGTMLAGNAIAAGPFANLAGQSLSMTIGARLWPDAVVEPLVACLGGTLVWGIYPTGALAGPDSGALLVGGDTTWSDLLTLPGAYFNSNNLTFALNVFAALCDTPGAGLPLLCSPALANSTGGPVTLANTSLLGPGPLHLEALGGPPGEFGYFLVSRGASPPGQPVGGGLLCLAAPIGRYVSGAGALFDSLGVFDGGGLLQSVAGTSTVGSGFDVPQNLPAPLGGSIQAGTSYYFQCWYRDGTSSNFSDVVQFQ